MFTIGKEYRRRDLHSAYRGQEQGGISTPADGRFVMLFSSQSGEDYGYEDGWTSDDVFLYTGEGQRGDMAFKRGNLAIRDHSLNARDLHLFEQTRKGYVRYLGPMVCTGYQERTGPDADGRERRVIVFELVPADKAKTRER
ncbi:MAG: HNH endonuclease [Chloroflexi bacterium]|nr:HNH endonuclease [Chloroflexota bacterium]